jgi:hypothetical protein
MKRTKKNKGQSKNEWIGKKISELIRENYQQDQAVAIAYSMYEQAHKENGGYYQTGATHLKKPFTGYGIPGIATPNISNNFKTTTQTNPPIKIGQIPANSNIANTTKAPQMGYYDGSITEDINNPEQSLGLSYQQQTPQDYAKSLQGAMLTSYGEDMRADTAAPQVQTQEEKDFATKVANTTNQQNDSPFQFFNPYAGADPVSGASGLGTAIEQGDILGIIGNSIRTLAPLARAGFAGAGNARRGNYVMQDAMEKYREGLKPPPQMAQNGGYFKKGGNTNEEDIYTPTIDNQSEYVQNPYDRESITEYNNTDEMSDEESAKFMENYNRDQNITTEGFDSNSARDTWVHKTGLPWSEAKRLGYTDGSAKDNSKLLSELKDERFRKDNLRSAPLKTNTQVRTPIQHRNTPTGRLSPIKPNQSWSEAMKGKPTYTGNHGNISVPNEGNMITRTGERLANPIQTFGHLAKYGELPSEGFSKNDKNDYDQVIGMLNPMYWANAIGNASDYASEGEYQKAAWESIDALPALSKIKYVKYLKNLPANQLSRIPGAKLLLSEAANTGMVKSASNAVRFSKKAPLNFYEEPAKLMPNYLQIGEGAKRLGFQNGGYFQDGGMQTMGQQAPPQMQSPQEEQMEGQSSNPQEEGQEQQLMMQIAQALQSGATPEQIVQELLNMGMPQEQAIQSIQMVMQQMQGQNPQEEQAEGASSNPQEEQQEQQSFEMGGTKKKSFHKILTGEYTAEKDNVEDEDIVAELEHTEFIKKPDGDITQVLGKSHEQGGVQLTEEQLPENSKILSDHLKPPTEVVKMFKDLGVSSKDTYAGVLEKWSKKSGLKKIVEEQEELIKKLEVQTKLLVDRPNSKDAIQLNTNLLQSKIAELEKEKAPLDKQREDVFEHLFAAQEGSKEEKEKEQTVMQNGGNFNGDIIVKYAKKHGISPERAHELVNQYKNGGVTKYKNGDDVRYDDFYKQAVNLGYTGKNNPGDIQRFMNQNYPQEVIDYYTKSKQHLNASHVDILKKENPWVFEKLGISPNKPSAKYTNEEKDKLFEAYRTDNRIEKSDNDNFLLRGFADNKWDWRAPVMGVSNLTPIGMQKQQISAPNPFIKGIPVAGQQEQQQAIVPQKEDKFANLEQTQRSKTGLMAFADQRGQLPTPLQGVAKMEYRPELQRNLNVTADPIIAEINRANQTAMQSIRGLPDEQRAAMEAQIQANTQEQINKAMNQVQGQNLQSNLAVNNANAQTLNQAQDINNRYLSDYENKMYTGQAKTDADIRNLFIHNQKENNEKWNAVNRANLYNKMADNYQMTDRGLELMNSPQLSYDNTSSDENDKNILRKDAKIKAEEKKVAKKPTAKNGGRFKKRN